MALIFSPLLAVLVLSTIQDNEFALARLIYTGIFLIAVSVVAHGWYREGLVGVFAPLPMVMLGYIYFFCYIPAVSPAVIASLYGDTARVAAVSTVVGASLILFLLGYNVPLRRRRIAPATTEVSGRRLILYVCLLTLCYIGLAIGIGSSSGLSLSSVFLASRYTQATSRLNLPSEGAAYYLQQLYRWLPIVIASPAAYCAKRFRGSRPFMIPVLLLVTLGTFAMGIRYVFAYTLTSIAVTFLVEANYHPQARRSGGSGRYMPYILLAGMVLLAAAQLQLRNSSGGSGGLLSGDSSFDAVKALSDTSAEMGADQNYSLDGVIQSYRDKTLALGWGESYGMTFVMIVPRAWWPTKPGANLAEQLAAANPFANANVSYSAPGELIFNFGWTGMIIGMLLFGVVARLWTDQCRRNWNSAKVRMMFATSVAPFAFLVRGSFATMFGAWMYPAIISYFLLRACQVAPAPGARRGLDAS
jgi:oligosaccharide repeat unit polymerase